MDSQLLRRAVGIFGVLFLGVGAVGSIVDPADDARAVKDAAAPVLNVRRVPDVLRMTIGRERLARSIDAVLADPTFAQARPTSCLHATVDGGTVVSDGADRAVIPASTLKILTAATALALIAPGTEFVTELRSATPLEGGAVAGDLWFVGGGDPLLETADYTTTQDHSPEIATSLEALADQLVATGVRRIDGSVVGDDRRYDAVRSVKTWKRGYLTSGEVGPIGGLSVNDNFTTMNSKGRRTGATDIGRDAAAELTKLLVDRGVTVVGEPRSATVGDAPASTVAPQVLATISSAPIEKVVQETLVWSDNTAAEMLLKEVGFRASGAPGTAATGVDAIRAYAQTKSSGTYAAVDGSGLDRSDTVTCRLLADVLAQQPVDGSLESALPVMGQTGTLRRRLRGEEAQGKVRAKTGSLNGVSSLAGFADTKDGGRAVFSFVGNGLSSTAIGVSISNRIAQELVRFPDAPDSKSLALPESN